MYRNIYQIWPFQIKKKIYQWLDNKSLNTNNCNGFFIDISIIHILMPFLEKFDDSLIFFELKIVLTLPEESILVVYYWIHTRINIGRRDLSEILNVWSHYCMRSCFWIWWRFKFQFRCTAVPQMLHVRTRPSVFFFLRIRSSATAKRYRNRLEYDE